VVHAAAMKVVPKCEYDPFEAVHTNVIGAENVIRSAFNTGVKRVVALSTDKACAPVNLYGATKLAAEKLFLAARNLGGNDSPVYNVCRYGNIVGSRGSVLPLFQRLKAEGKPLTLTHPDMTRFWYRMDQAIDLVMMALESEYEHCIFVPKIPSVRILDLAEAVDPGGERVWVGIRPGEKIHETLITEDESRNLYFGDGHWIIDPRRPPTPTVRIDGSVWKYTSGTNDEWLSVEELGRSL
jgi:UDP-N-acetylglucosamine 4,6-dehydratase